MFKSDDRKRPQSQIIALTPNCAQHPASFKENIAKIFNHQKNIGKY